MPPPEVLPSNVTLRLWDVREEVHEDLVGVFDVIQIRFFIFVLLRDEVPSVVGKLAKMLSMPFSHTEAPSFISRAIFLPLHAVIS
jgi:hypothetical protein